MGDAFLARFWRNYKRRMTPVKWVALVIGITGFVVLGLSGGFWITAAVFLLLWAHNMERHTDD